jgi:hypothetical protein
LRHHSQDVKQSKAIGESGFRKSTSEMVFKKDLNGLNLAKKKTGLREQEKNIWNLRGMT